MVISCSQSCCQIHDHWGLVQTMFSAVAPTWHLSAALSWGHRSKVPSTGWLRITEIHSLRVLEANGPKPRCLQDHAPSETCREGRFLPRLASGSCSRPSVWGNISPVSTWSSPGALSRHLSSGHGLCPDLPLFCKDTTWDEGPPKDCVLT